MLFLEPKQVIALADAIGPHYRTLVLFAAYTGLRAGEIEALRVHRVDLDHARSSVEVVESLTDVRGHLVFGPTKTHSRRMVRLPAFLRDLLEAHLVGRAADRDGLVFTGDQGGPIRHNLFYARHFKVTIDRYGHLLPSLDETLVDGLDTTYRASVGGGVPQVGVAA